MAESVSPAPGPSSWHMVGGGPASEVLPRHMHLAHQRHPRGWRCSVPTGGPLGNLSTKQSPSISVRPANHVGDTLSPGFWISSRGSTAHDIRAGGPVRRAPVSEQAHCWPQKPLRCVAWPSDTHSEEVTESKAQAHP